MIARLESQETPVKQVKNSPLAAMAWQSKHGATSIPIDVAALGSSASTASPSPNAVTSWGQLDDIPAALRSVMPGDDVFHGDHFQRGVATAAPTSKPSFETFSDDDDLQGSTAVVVEAQEDDDLKISTLKPSSSPTSVPSASPTLSPSPDYIFAPTSIPTSVPTQLNFYQGLVGLTAIAPAPALAQTAGADAITDLEIMDVSKSFRQAGADATTEDEIKVEIEDRVSQAKETARLKGSLNVAQLQAARAKAASEMRSDTDVDATEVLGSEHEDVDITWAPAMAPMTILDSRPSV
jgi:hypothetical protein